MEGAAGSQENQVDAKTITCDSDDLALAEVIQAVLNPTAQQQARNVQAISTYQARITANQQRIDANKANLDEVAQSTQKRLDEMGEVVTKDQYTLLFTTGDYSLSDEAKQRLAYSKGWIYQWRDMPTRWVMLPPTRSSARSALKRSSFTSFRSAEFR